MHIKLQNNVIAFVLKDKFNHDSYRVMFTGDCIIQLNKHFKLKVNSRIAFEEVVFTLSTFNINLITKTQYICVTRGIQYLRIIFFRITEVQK